MFWMTQVACNTSACVQVIGRLAHLRSQIHSQFIDDDAADLNVVDRLDNITSQLTDWQRLRHDAAVVL